MMPVGEILRRERLRRKVEIAQIIEELKISSRTVEAMETDAYDKLPGGVFAKSFVRQYANLLGLDGNDVAAQFERAAHLPELKNLAELRKPTPKTGLARLEDRHFSVGRPRNALSSLLVVVAMVVVCSVVYAWWQRNRLVGPTRHATSSVAAARTLPRVQVRPNPVPQTASAGHTVPTPAPAATTPQPVAFQPGVPQPLVPGTEASGNAAVQVELVVAEPVWVSVQRDGQSIFQGELQPNEIRTLAANTEITLKLGNAGGLTILLNGKPIPAAGPKGQVRTVQLTSGGFQIVPEPGAPAPAPATPPRAPALLAPL